MRRTRGSFALAALALALVAGTERADDAPEPASIDDLRALIAGGEYGEAEAGARSLVERVERDAGPGSIEAARVLDVLAESRWRAGKAGEGATLELAERALEIKERELGPEHAELAESLNNLAAVFFFRADYAAARPPWERALAIREKALGPDHPLVAQSLNSLANLLQTVGDYARAQALYERALAIREKALGPDHPLVAQTLSNLGWLLADLGDYARARSSLERALAIREKALGAGHPQVASTLSALASVLWKTGDREAARPLFERALRILEEALGPGHPSVADSLENVGWLLLGAHRYAEARPPLERALRILEEAYEGQDHPSVGLALNNLGELCEAEGELANARALLERASAMREKTLGPEHPELAESLTALARVLAKSGRLADARGALERAVAIRELALGPQHPAVAESLAGLALVLATEGETAEALAVALRAEEISREHLRLAGRSLSEQEAVRYAAVRDRGIDLALSLAPDRLSPAARRRVLDALVRSRAVVLDEMAARRRTVAAGGPAIAALASELDSARSRLANLTVRGLGNEDPEVYRKMLDEARGARERAERALAAGSSAFAREQARGRAGLDEIESNLPEDGALVALALHGRTAFAAAEGDGARTLPGPPEPFYTALVDRRGAAGPVAVPIGPASVLDPLIASWKREAAIGVGGPSERSAARYEEVGTRLRQALWDPLAPHLKNVRTVFVVPDGALHVVNLATLPIGRGRFLLEKGPLLHHLSAERDLVPSEEPAGRGLLAFGGPDYGERSGNAGSATGTRSACGSFDSLRFDPLPAAAREAEQVVELWRAAARAGAVEEGEVVHFSGARASESAFKREAPGHRVLHVATHGFFLGRDCEGAGAQSRGFQVVGEPPSAPLEGTSPLLLSGLALAGANTRASASATDDDGILTAEEIAAVDLSGVEWAVLSACSTGLGEIQAGEGVFGLRRAMQVAGVRTLILSLWPVDDEATRLWMEAFYRARLNEGRGPAEAVHAASLDVLKRARKGAWRGHPAYWGAFVAAGGQ